MGLFSSKYVRQHHFNTSGNFNKIFIINGAQFDIASIFNQTIENVVEKMQNIIINNNPVIILGTVLILFVITCLFICLYVLYHNRQLVRVINLKRSIYPITSSVVSPTYNEKVLSKNISNNISGYLA